jgi:aspartate/methionine/tyrosine aminotransferase
MKIYGAVYRASSSFIVPYLRASNPMRSNGRSLAFRSSSTSSLPSSRVSSSSVFSSQGSLLSEHLSKTDHSRFRTSCSHSPLANNSRQSTRINASKLGSYEHNGRKNSIRSISSRGAAAVGLLPTYLSDARNVQRYHKDNNPNGALQLGVAENLLMEDWLLPALNNNMPDLSADAIYYQTTHGRLGLRTAFRDYMYDLLELDSTKITLDTDGLIVGAGCNAVLENLCFVLADPGDAILIPTPYYAAFEFDTAARAQLYVQPVTTMDYQNKGATAVDASAGFLDPAPYYPTVRALDAAYERALAHGNAPRILLLSHPHNPLGICYPAYVLKECIEWAVAKQIYVISDEIYAGSVYQAESGFTSVIDLLQGDLGTYVHWIYSMSKDFCASGLRIGALYTQNEDIRLPLQKLNDLCQLSSQTQVWAQHFLENKSLVADFRAENHSRVRKRAEKLTNLLQDLDIPYAEPTAGMFVWINLSNYLRRDGSAPSEQERTLYLELVDRFGLLLTPGLSMRNEEPGFFRCVFTAATDDEFKVALERLRTFAEAKSSR